MAQYYFTRNQGTSINLPPSREITRGEKIKIILWLLSEVAKYGLTEKVMIEFRKRGLDIKYHNEIEAWKKYKDEKDFEKKLEKQMQEEIERFLKTKKNSEELIKETFPEPEYKIFM